MTLQMVNAGPYPDRKLSQAAKQRLWKSLLETKCSTHSALHETLPYLINRLEQEGRAYRLEAHPGIGYALTLINHARDVR